MEILSRWLKASSPSSISSFLADSLPNRNVLFHPYTPSLCCTINEDYLSKRGCLIDMFYHKLSEFFETQQGSRRLWELHFKKQYFMQNFCSLLTSSASSPKCILLNFVASLFIVMTKLQIFNLINDLCICLPSILTTKSCSKPGYNLQDNCLFLWVF